MKLKIAILHHDIEPPEPKFKEFFKLKGHFVDLIDIRNTSHNALLDYDLIINRVYSSVASRDFKVLNKTLNLLKKLESSGKICINSYKSFKADYNKYYLYRELSKKGIFTPQTIFIKNQEKINEIAHLAAKKLGFPLVVKRNCGGKSYDVNRVNSLEELITSLKNKFVVAENQKYRAGFILQKFVKSIRNHDCRVGIVDQKFAFSYARSLVPRDSEDNWVASTAGGSVEFDYLANKEEIDIALKANIALGTFFSESDVIFTEKGPCIIEVNFSPNYFMDSLDDIQRMEIIVDGIISLSKTKSIEDNISIENIG